jgi:hypothetical protein
MMMVWAGAALAAESPWDLGADLRFETVAWPQAYGENTNSSLNRLQLIPTLTGKPSVLLRFYFKPELFWDPQNNSPEERLFLNLGEAYVRLQGETTSLQLGSNIVNWGVTDGYNPLDVVNSRQYFDPLHSKKLGAVGAILSHATEASDQALIFIPENQASMLPGTESRWLPRQVFIPWSPDANEILILPDTLRYHYRSPEVLDRALSNNVAARLQWHWSGIDVGVIGYEGVASFPILQPEITGTIEQVSPRVIIRTDPDVILRVKQYRTRVVGYSWVSSQSNFLLKYASSYSVSLGTDPLLPGWEHRNIVALERNFQPRETIAITAVLQYAFVNSERSNDSNLSVNEIFRRAWMAGFRWSFGDAWTATALGLYDTVHFSHFQDLSIARRFYDIWTLQANAVLISGAPDTPLGVYDHNDTYTLSLSRSF